MEWNCRLRVVKFSMHECRKKYVSWSGMEPSPLVQRPLNGVLYQPRMMMNDDECGTFGVMLGKGNRITQRKPAPIAALSTTNPT
jgi:hypothetical protein